VSEPSTTPNLSDEGRDARVPEREMARFRDNIQLVSTTYTSMSDEGASPRDDAVIPDTTMYYIPANTVIVDLYSVDALRRKGSRTSVPFIHWVALTGPRGEVVRFRSTVDDGAMVNAIDEESYKRVSGRLRSLERSERQLRMADGRVKPSLGVWKGQITIKGAACKGDFEVFSSGGAWTLLVGKPLLESFGAIHNYSNDTISIPMQNSENLVVIRNQNEQYEPIKAKAERRKEEEEKVERKEERETEMNEMKVDEGEGDREGGGRDNANGTVPFNRPALAWVTEPEPESTKAVWNLEEESVPGAEQPDITRIFEPTILTRKTEPFKPERVAAVLREVTIGGDLNTEERKGVESLITEFADCFALSMSEVLVVEGAHHRLDIPKDTAF
jgi:hypothetical protein